MCSCVGKFKFGRNQKLTCKESTLAPDEETFFNDFLISDTMDMDMVMDTVTDTAMVDTDTDTITAKDPLNLTMDTDLVLLSIPVMPLHMLHLPPGVWENRL